MICEDWGNPAGADRRIHFRGRRTVPLVTEASILTTACSWGDVRKRRHSADVGRLPRPVRVLPFCGYNMADYAHWFAMGDRLGAKTPKIFYVNWFRTSRDGRWLWPGFGENSRVLKWICQRIEGAIAARQTPIGQMPRDGDLDLEGLDIPAEDFAELMEVDRRAFNDDLDDAGVPGPVWNRVPTLRAQLSATEAAGLKRWAQTHGKSRATAVELCRQTCGGDCGEEGAADSRGKRAREDRDIMPGTGIAPPQPGSDDESRCTTSPAR